MVGACRQGAQVFLEGDGEKAGDEAGGGEGGVERGERERVEIGRRAHDAAIVWVEPSESSKLSDYMPSSRRMAKSSVTEMLTAKIHHASFRFLSVASRGLKASTKPIGTEAPRALERLIG